MAKQYQPRIIQLMWVDMQYQAVPLSVQEEKDEPAA